MDAQGSPVGAIKDSVNRPTSTEAIGVDEFRGRRRELIAKMAPGTLALVPAAKARLRNRDVEYVFRQNSDFWYLCGFSEPDALLVLAPGREEGESILFCQEREAQHTLYHGERLGPEGAVETLQVDEAHPLDAMDAVLPGLLAGKARLYVTLGDHPDFDPRLLAWVAALRTRESGGTVAPREFIGLGTLLHEQRLIKSPAERRLLGRAAAITAAAHVRAMRACRGGLNETQLEGELRYAFLQGGARAPAYPPIVGGGANACVLHYTANNAPLRDGDLVLIDAGCEYEHYAADLTRTFPAGGRFSDTQRQLYEIVLDAQKRAIAACVVGASCNRPHEVALRTMIEGLMALGWLDGGLDEILESHAHRVFCPHRSSHWLGLDVHDVGDYRVDGEWRVLREGMVLTVEPGLYVPPGLDVLSSTPAVTSCRGIGIRIEDEVLIGADGPVVLTAAAPKEIADIETIMGGA